MSITRGTGNKATNWSGSILYRQQPHFWVHLPKSPFLLRHLCNFSDEPFREFASFFDGAPLEHVQTLTRPQLKARASCRCVRWGKCRSMKMCVLGTERTSSPHVTVTLIYSFDVHFKIRRHFPKNCGILWPRKTVRLINHNLNRRVGSGDRRCEHP